MSLPQKLSPFSKHLQSFLMPGSLEPRECVTGVGFCIPAATGIWVSGDDGDPQLLGFEISFLYLESFS